MNVLKSIITVRSKTCFWCAWVLLTALALSWSGGVRAQTATDVPPSHWAYEAVQNLVNRGYLALEDGRFSGTESVDRFTLASVVARILHEIESGTVAPQSREDVELLRQVVNEFREDLVEAYNRIETVEGGVERVGKSQVATDVKLSEVIAILAALEGQASDLAQRLEETERQLARRLEGSDQQLAESNQRIDQLELAHQAALAAQAAELRARINELANTLTGQTATEQQVLRGEVADLISQLREESQARFQETERRIDVLEENLTVGIAESESSVDALRSQLAAERERLSEVERTIQGVSEELSALNEDLRDLAFGAEDALEEIRSALNAQAESLAAQQLALEQRGAALEGSLADLEAKLAEVSGTASRMQARIDGVERQVLAMQSQLGLSEEQLAALSDRLMNELDSRYQHSFLLSGNVANELAALKEEFNSYRQRTEKDLSQARQAQTFGLIGAVLGLIGLVAN